MTIFHEATRAKLTRETDVRERCHLIAEAIRGSPEYRAARRVEFQMRPNEVVLREPSSGNELAIFCEGQDRFRLKRTLGLQRRVSHPRRSPFDGDPVTLSQLDDHVAAWLRDPRAV